MNTITVVLLRHVGFMLACAIFVAGCAHVPGQGTDFNSANVSKLKVGETTEREVIQLFGKPGMRTRNADGVVILSYQYIPGSMVTMFDLYVPRTEKIRMKMLIVTLDANGRVQNFTESGSE